MLICDWCGESIEERDYATIEPGGYYKGGKGIRMRVRTYHSSHEYSDGPSEQCCFGKVLRLLNADAEFEVPDAGMEWRLVPCSESANRAYSHNYTDPALGTTPLEELKDGLTPTTYRKLTQYGVFTVEHLVDARKRGRDFTLNVKALTRLDAVLLERGLLPETRTANEVDSC